MNDELIDEKPLFETWNRLKQKLSCRKRKLFFYEREVWFCLVGKNVSSEQDGQGKDFRRPVLVLKKFGSFGFFGLPLSSRKKEGSWFYNLASPLGNAENSCILLLQGRFFSSSRLSHKLGKISKEEFKTVQKKTAKLYCGSL